MNTIQTFITATFFSLHLSPAIADATPGFGDRDQAAEACYQYTQDGAAGETITQRAVDTCTRALSRGPHTNAHKSTVYHNRALLELALGRVEDARASLEQSVTLADEPGMQHVALAQLAHKQGDLVRAAAIYDELLQSRALPTRVARYRDVLARNRESLRMVASRYNGSTSEF